MSDEHEELERYDWGPSGVEPWTKGAYYSKDQADAALAKLRAKVQSLTHRFNESEEERIYFRRKYEEASERGKELEAENAGLRKELDPDRLFPRDYHPAEVELREQKPADPPVGRQELARTLRLALQARSSRSYASFNDAMLRLEAGEDARGAGEEE